MILLPAKMELHCVSKEQFDEFVIHQLKTCGFREEVLQLMDLKEVGPGYPYKVKDVDMQLLLQCGLCRQIATDPFACNVCYLQYCRRCVITIINIKKSIEWEKKVEMTDSPVDEAFRCMNNCQNSKVIFYLADDIKNIHEKQFKCPIKGCEVIYGWVRMANHVLKCTAGTTYEVNVGEWGYEFLIKIEKPYEIAEGWEDFVLGEFEREVATQNITFVEPEIKHPPIKSEV